MFEKELENPDKKDKKILTDNNGKDFNYKIKNLLEINNNLNKKFMKRFWLYFFLSGLGIGTLIYSIYTCFWLKKYINTYGLGNGDFLINLLNKYEYYYLAGKISANVDSIYWIIGVSEYLLLPAIIIYINNVLISFYKKNLIYYNINKVLITNHNLLNNSEYISIFEDEELKIIEESDLEKFCNYINNSFVLKK